MPLSDHLIHVSTSFCQWVLASQGWGTAWQPSKVTRSLYWTKTRMEDPQVSLGWASLWNVIFFLSALWHCWLGDKKGIRPVKSWVLVLLVVTIWLELCTSYASSCHHHIIILSSNKIDVLVPAYVGCPGKWPLNERRLSQLLPQLCKRCEWIGFNVPISTLLSHLRENSLRDVSE